MEPDAKVDNDIAMMMIKKRIEQTPLRNPTIRVLLERVELPGPLSRRASRHLRSKIDRPPVPGGAGFALVGRMFSKRKEGSDVRVAHPFGRTLTTGLVWPGAAGPVGSGSKAGDHPGSSFQLAPWKLIALAGRRFIAFARRCGKRPGWHPLAAVCASAVWRSVSGGG